MTCAESIVVLGVITVQSFWTDGAGRRVLSELGGHWVEVRANVYAPRDQVGDFSAKAEQPAICRAFRELDLAIEDLVPPKASALVCLEYAPFSGDFRLACRRP